jgi:hypothetical protein
LVAILEKQQKTTMSYKDKFEQSDKKALNSLIATKILDLMDKLRLDANENAQRRWIWELLQNAKDVAFDNQQVATEVNIQVSNGKKAFRLVIMANPFRLITLLFSSSKFQQKNAQQMLITKNPRQQENSVQAS